MRLATIINAVHYSKDGDILWQATNLPNTLHTQGQQYMLETLFTGLAIPQVYYVGLDNRSVINQADILASITSEPTGNGYQRYALNSQTGFTPNFNLANWTVVSNTLLFTAVGGSWGPVKNAFLTTASSTQGFLISSLPLSSAITVNNGETFSFQLVLGLGG
jgi:hypothetical protein